jgi:hypothetical protein
VHRTQSARRLPESRGRMERDHVIGDSTVGAAASLSSGCGLVDPFSVGQQLRRRNAPAGGGRRRPPRESPVRHGLPCLGLALHGSSTAVFMNAHPRIVRFWQNLLGTLYSLDIYRWTLLQVSLSTDITHSSQLVLDIQITRIKEK